MRIQNLMNTNISDITDKRFNIVIGISLGNKFFSPENIESYLKWAIDNTKDKVVVLIPDKIHSINYEVKNGYTREQADKLAFQQGEKVRMICENIINNFNDTEKSSISILKWKDIETNRYEEMLSIIISEFNQNINFKQKIVEIVQENINDKVLEQSDYEKLAMYVVEELPMLIGGVEYGGDLYELLPYPGISKIDYFTIDIQEGKVFPDMVNKLNIKSKMKIIELYTE